jgi:hypothetical protein
MVGGGGRAGAFFAGENGTGSDCRHCVWGGGGLSNSALCPAVSEGRGGGAGGKGGRLSAGAVMGLQSNAANALK